MNAACENTSEQRTSRPPAARTIPAAEAEQYRLTTAEFAQLNHVAPSTVASKLSRTGSYYGVRPLKLASGRVRWPEVVAVA